MPGTNDPTTVRSVAVTAQDVVAAHEAGLQADRAAVLRITPPFSGRMRARLHVSEVVPGEAAAGETGPDAGGTAPIEIPPGDLLEDPPSYPHPDETEDALRADQGAEYTRERHRERHEAALDAWREAVADRITDAVAVRTAAGTHEVEVVVLGDEVHQ